MDQPVLQDVPDHVDANIQAIARLHAAHASSATPVERIVEGVMAFLGRPAFAGILTFFIAAWIGVDLWPGPGRQGAFDRPPFPMLQTLLALAGVYMMAVVLIVQRRAKLLGDHREQLMLQLALLSDQKTAKLIALLEELRRDDPLIRNRADDQAAELTKPADPESMLEVIRESHEQLPEPPEDPA